MNRTLYRTRIKFCGMTRAGDVRLAGELGVDAVGFVFAAGSPRRLAPAEARAMRQAIAPMVDVVALFRDNSREEVREVLRAVRPTLLQFHGEEEDAFCRSFNLPYLKAVPMGGREEINARTLQLQYPNAAGFLFDSHAPGEGGGTGQAFDWSRLPTGLHRPFLLAGGIKAENVFDAIIATLPWGVDVSSGIEAEPGIKDGNKMRRFVEEVRRADCHELS
ncbi:phosphoribosylanthranilate isomerase [Stenotrophomonas sp. MMGLT7]|uniref:phosphoribosylanthranilate isomerase n=1 Tax=Stenotrophomonas sp. MMGLT7 TaxID=2901227 RepID=UPI001E4D07CC|nr:phosphoribosylanthranilate isomerase [Stenotrophomonas sp. MMGLT7]MCD7098672.1 phosphoribosylanthranilate isomerase [Stenotrophomonas sp. MMGLT7]